MILDLIFKLMQNMASRVDAAWFAHNQKKQKRLARFFYVSSFFTHFFLFSFSGNFLLSLFAGLVFFLTSGFFVALVSMFAESGIIEGTKFLVLGCPIPLIVLIFFVIFLWDITFVNTFLVLCPSIKAQILSCYGIDFLKKRGYNSLLSSLKAASQLSKFMAAAIGISVAAGALVIVNAETAYGQNYADYMRNRIEHPHIEIEPPQKGIIEIQK